MGRRPGSPGRGGRSAQTGSAPPPPSRYVSACVLDGVALTLWADMDLLRPLLHPWATPAPIPRRPRGKHPILIEAWLVKEGRMEAGAASVALDPASWWRGWMGWFQEGAQGAMQGAQAGSGAFRALLAGWSSPRSLLGSYSEVAITVPARLAGDATGETFAYVAGMYTDSPVAIWGDRTMQCGYRKRLARIVRPSARELRVESPDGASIITLDLGRGAGKDLGAGTDRLALPYLGGLAGRRFAISVMDRSAGETSILAAPVAGRITCAAGFVESLPALSGRVAPLSPRSPWGGFRFEGISARLTYPHHGSL